MRTVWKIVIVLALVLPSGAFVAGSLAASSADPPSPRHTIVIRDDSASPSPGRAGPSADRSDDHPDRSVEVVTPTPGDLRDDHGGASGGGHGGDDGGAGSGSGSGSGHGGGSDDGGGHGGGHG